MQNINTLELPLVSIVMGYYNRIDQTEITLDTISKTEYKNFEVIIVDDGSTDQHDLKKIIYKYNYYIKLIKINKTQKKWINPCVPYNIGLQIAKGDIIIIQNPEVAHVGDVIKFTIENISEGIYLGYSVYTSPSFMHNKIFKNMCLQNKDYIQTNFIDTIDNKNYQFNYEYYINKYNDIQKLNYTDAYNHWNTIGINEGRVCNSTYIYQPDAYIKWKGWYNHPEFNNRPYHFLTAITRNDLKKVGGFDDNFKNGLWYDDDDFLRRVSKVCSINNLGNEKIFGVHLFHSCGSAEQMNQKNFIKLSYINKRIKKNNIKNNKINVYTGDPNDYLQYEIIENKIA